MASVYGFVKRNWTALSPPDLPKSDGAIRIGLLGASWIGPSSIIKPAKSHPDVIIAAVASRDQSKAKIYAEKHGIPKIYSSYEDLLDDATIDAVYIPLPNNLHYEWAVRSLRCGKHVLLEKPSVSNAVEAKRLFTYHSTLPSPAPVLLEAVHYLFHPAWQTFLSLLAPSQINSVFSALTAPAGAIPKHNIRFQYELSGGALMDMGTYCVSTLRQVFGTEPETCLTAQGRLAADGTDQKCERAIHAKWRFPNGGTGSIKGDLELRKAGWPGVEFPKVVVEHLPMLVEDETVTAAGQSHWKTRTVTIWNYIAPAVWHRIDIMDEHVLKGSEGGNHENVGGESVKKAYTWGDEMQREGLSRTGDEFWSTYRHMLEQFVNKIKGRNSSGIWVDGEHSIKQMIMIDAAYTKAGLLTRPTSTYE